MKRVIGGKLYDTETADMVCFWASSNDRRDFSQYEETLYRTKKGAFFVVGKGGPNTQYGRQVSQNSWTEGEGMRVLSDGAARQWLEEHDAPAENIIDLFPVEEA